MEGGGGDLVSGVEEGGGYDASHLVLSPAKGVQNFAAANLGGSDKVGRGRLKPTFAHTETVIGDSLPDSAPVYVAL